MKRLIYWLFSTFGIVALFRYFHRNSLTILLYHGVAPHADVGIYNYRGKFIDPHDFEMQMRYFAKRYSIVELDEAVRMLRDGALPKNALSLTFDDGYKNFYQYAFPILKRMGIPATMFVATDFVLHKQPLWVDRLEYAMGTGDGTRTEKSSRDATLRNELKQMPDEERERQLNELEKTAGVSFDDFSGERAVYAPLSDTEMREMQSAGVRFGAHTKTHPILLKLPPTRVEEEVHGSKIALETLLGPISSVFAYPNGQSDDWNESVEKAVLKAGFSAALTTLEGTNTRDAHQLRLRRMVMDATDKGSAFAVIASGVRLFLKSLI